jgi:hypothetical protein
LKKSNNLFLKNEEFYADFRMIEKVAKKCTHKKLEENQFDEQE